VPGDVTLPTWAVFAQQPLQPAAAPGALEPGLRWEYAEGNPFALLWKGAAPVLDLSGPGAKRQPIPAAWLQRAQKAVSVP
jgi:hypothetical protein